MSQEPRFHVVTSSEGDKLQGFITFWTMQGFTYVEHLAVEPALRGHGLGAALLRQAVDAQQAPLLLEVEPPVDDITHRRVHFYNRAGLVLRDDVQYMQPSYGPGKPAIAMCIMTTASMPHDTLLDAIDTLRRDVYGCKD